MNTPHSTTLLRVLAFGALTACSAASLEASTVLINENFDSIADNAGLNAAGWYYRHGSASTSYWPGPIAYENGTLSGNVLRGGSGSSGNNWVLKQWGGTTLTNVGDSLSLSFDTSFNLPARFNVSFFDAGGTEITANSHSVGIPTGTNSVIAGATGYGFEQIYASGTATSGGIGTTTAALNGFDTVALQTSLETLPTLSGDVFTFTFSVTMVETGAQISFLKDGALVDSWTDTSVSGSVSFDTLKLWISASNSATANRALDNVVLTHTSNIPEPSTAAALVGLATLGLAITRRQRRR
ncbi:MAG: PEP-CTERM sorting domain-containing protein [Verrucomicrobiota bacterium]